MELCQVIIEHPPSQPDLFHTVMTGDNTWKPTARVVSESDRCCRGHRKQEKSKLKTVLLRSAMRQESSSMSSLHRVRRSISKSTRGFFDNCFARCTRGNECYGRENRDCFTLTIHLLTTP